MDALKKPAGFKPGRMMTLKMADGGYHKGSKDGGRVTGPGGPVADKVPAMYSNGEYVLPADTAKHIGYKKLDAIKDATHTPAAARRKGFVPGGMADGGYRPNFTMPEDIPEYREQLKIGGPAPGTALQTVQRPNFTMPGENGAVSGGSPTARRFDTADAVDVQARAKPILSPEAATGEYLNPTPKPAPASNYVSPGVGGRDPFAPEAPAAGRAPAAPSGFGVAREALNRVASQGQAAINGVTGSQPSALASKLAQGAKGFATGAAKLAGKAATPLAVGMEGYDVAKVAADPNASRLDVATQAAQGGGRLGAAGAGAATGAAIGTATIPIPIVGTVLGGLAGGAAGYYGADKLIETGRRMFGADAAAPASRAPSLLPDQPAEQAVQAQAKATTAPNPFAETSNAGAERGYVNPPLANSPAQEALQAAQAPAGNVQVTRQPNGVMEFSGKDIAGPVSYTGTTGFKSGGFGVSTPGEPGDGRRVMEMNNRLADEMRAAREGTAGDPFVYRQATGQDWQSRLDRRNAEVSASSIVKDNRRAMFDRQVAAMDARDLQGLQEDSDTARARMENATKAAQANAVSQLAAQRLSLDQQRLGMEQTAQGFQARGMQRLEAAQQALLNPKATPEQRKQAQSTLAALNGKTAAADRMQVVNLPDTVDATGTKMGGGQALVRFREDGSVEQVPIGAQQAQAQALPEKGALVKGQIYQTPRGAARWDGAQFIPV
jgi:hypothetical protein